MKTAGWKGGRDARARQGVEIRDVFRASSGFPTSRAFLRHLYGQFSRGFCVIAACEIVLEVEDLSSGS